MADETQSDISRKPLEMPKTKPDATDRGIYQTESLLDQTEWLLGEAVGQGETLSDATWRLTLARWNLGRRETFDRQWPRQTAIVVAATATVVYLTYRLLWTMNLANPGAVVFSAVLLAAEFYAGAMLGLYFFQVWRLINPAPRRPRPGKTVDVFVATYNEDVALLRGTLIACLDMDYPHVTYVLDDGAREEVKQLAESLGVRYISRTERSHAKAGNLNNALRQTNGEYVVILDADHVPYRHYLMRLIGYFDDPRVGFVQVPHTTYNLDNFMGRWKSKEKDYWEDVRIFYEAVQLGKNRYGVACFCGSAAIFRRKALEDVGLLATETITEDMHTSIRVNAAGWRSIAVGEEMVVGLAPDDAATFAAQRLRWGEGNLSIMAHDNPLTIKGLTLAGRINYLASIACWTLGPARLILYLTPLVMLLTGVAPVSDMSVGYFAIVGCYLATVWTAVKMASNRCGQLLGIEVAMMASFHLQIRALWRAVFRRGRQKFVVTEKRRSAKPIRLSHMWPQTLLVAVSIVAVSWALAKTAFGISGDYLGLFIGSGLAAYHSWLALTVLGRATYKRAADAPWQHPLCLAADYAIGGGVNAAIALECNENECRLLTIEPLDITTPLEVTFHTPVGTTVCQGRVATSTPIGRRHPFAYLHAIVFENDNPAERLREQDSLRRMIIRYVVPVVTKTHRFVRSRSRALPEELSGENDFPLPVTIDANLPNLAAQHSVALSVDNRGFRAVFGTPCPVGNVVRVTLNTPTGSIVTEADVADVETMRVGATIIYQHTFRWRNASSVRPVTSAQQRWQKSLTQSVSRLRKHRIPLARMVAWQIAASALVVMTLAAFSQVYSGDRLLVLAANRDITSTERAKVQIPLDQLAASPGASTDRLLRVYKAAVATGDDKHAADAAGRLADRVEDGHRWMLTSARHLARTSDRQAADAAFDHLIDQHMGSGFSLEEQTQIYVEAARAAVAVNHLDKAVDRFLKASNLTSTDEKQAQELLGVLIAARRTKLALQVLEQLDLSDRVLRSIVNVYEMANQPEAAILELKELLQRHPDDVNVVQRLAEIAVTQRDYAAGSAYYQTLHDLDPSNKHVAMKLAETLLMLARQKDAAGESDKAITLFDESFRIQTPDAKLKREYGGMLANQGQFEQAIGLLEKLHDTASRLQLAAILEMEGSVDRALQVLLDLEKTGELNDKARHSVARLLLANKKHAEAAERLVVLLEKNPDDPRLQRELIDAVAASDRWSNQVRQTTMNIYQQYHTNDFQGLDVQGFARLGDALRRLEFYTQANITLKKAVTEFPESRRLRFYLAQTLSNLGRYDDAETQYKILLSTRPTSAR